MVEFLVFGIGGGSFLGLCVGIIIALYTYWPLPLFADKMFVWCLNSDIYPAIYPSKYRSQLHLE